MGCAVCCVESPDQILKDALTTGKLHGEARGLQGELSENFFHLGSSLEEVWLQTNHIESLPNDPEILKGWESAKLIFLSHNNLSILPPGVRTWTNLVEVRSWF